MEDWDLCVSIVVSIERDTKVEQSVWFCEASVISLNLRFLGKFI